MKTRSRKPLRSSRPCPLLPPLRRPLVRVLRPRAQRGRRRLSSGDFQRLSINLRRSQTLDEIASEALRVERHVECHRNRKIGKDSLTDANAGEDWPTLTRCGQKKWSRNRCKHWLSRTAGKESHSLR